MSNKQSMLNSLMVDRYHFKYKINKKTVTIYDPLGFKDIVNISDIITLISKQDVVDIVPSDIEMYIRRTYFTVAKPA
jgi:hypothetical protein